MSATEADEHAPFIDYENLSAPTEGILVTLFITGRSVARSRAFYSEVLGGELVEENPCIVKLANSSSLMNPTVPPTPDKPDISVVNYELGNTVSVLRSAAARPRRLHHRSRSGHRSAPKRARHERPEDLPG